MTLPVSKEAPQDVAALRRLAKAATKGPWVKASGDAVFPLHSSMPVAWTRDMSPDAAYIAAANPTVVLGLLDQNDRLREAGEELSVTGNHRPDCPRIEWRGVQPECDCGWSEARDAWDTAQKAARP